MTLWLPVDDDFATKFWFSIGRISVTVSDWIVGGASSPFPLVSLISVLAEQIQ